MPLNLRQCRSNDLDRLAEISRKTFVDAFETDNNPDDFKAYIDSAFKKDKLSSELENRDTAFYFVFQDSALVGYLKLNENDAQSDIKAEEDIELERIYVLQDYQGQRIGEWMLNEVKKIASAKKKRFLWLGVWENNRKAIQFYRKHGFSKFGTHPYYVGNDKQTDWLMRFELNVIG
ncbi:MAG: GNAT family N-acetyltransferase [Pricia sp.]